MKAEEEDDDAVIVTQDGRSCLGQSRCRRGKPKFAAQFDASRKAWGLVETHEEALPAEAMESSDGLPRSKYFLASPYRGPAAKVPVGAWHVLDDKNTSALQTVPPPDFAASDLDAEAKIVSERRLARDREGKKHTDEKD